MNPFYSYSHNHLSQFSTNNNEIPSPSLTPLSAVNSHQHLQQSQQQHLQQSPPQSQFLQTSPTSQSSAASVAAAAAFFRNSGQDYQSRRHITNMNSTMSSPGVNSLSTNSTPWKNNCLMDNFKFEPNTNTLFGGFDDNLIHIAKQDNLYMAAAAAAANHPSNITSHHLHSMNSSRHPFENGNTNSLNEIGDRNINHHHHHHLNQTNPNSISDSNNVNNNPFYNAFYNAHHHQSISPPSTHQLSQHSAAAIAAAAANAIAQTDVEVDPRELEMFAERFKQRRIKLGVTQADVGQQLSKLKLPGVGSLSQSTICRFESLTLSHNNMIALKPVLHSWLEQAENDSRMKRKSDEVMSTSSTMTNSSSTSLTSMNSNCNVTINQNSNGHTTNSISSNTPSNNTPSMLMNNSSSSSSGSASQRDHDRKRKRTSIAAPEKRSLEAFFTVQPRPSGEKIAQIAEKLELKKNVVRVWFCNQRQKQKRMKFNAVQNR